MKKFMLLAVGLVMSITMFGQHPIGLSVAENMDVVFGKDTTGAGNKFRWITAKSALRAGGLMDNENTESGYWNLDSIGDHSVALGFNVLAKGNASIAVGHSVRAEEKYALATGFASVAKEIGSTAIGWHSKATGRYATAMGFNNQAIGEASVAIGAGNIAPSFREVVVGAYAEKYAPTDTTQFYTGSDRAFVVGNGVDEFSRSNALTILKNGKAGFGISTPMEQLEASGDVIIGGGMEKFDGTSEFLQIKSGVNDWFLGGQNTDPDPNDNFVQPRFFISTEESNPNMFFMDANGNVGIGEIEELSNKLEVSSDIEIGGGATHYDALAEFLQIHARNSDWFIGVQNEENEADGDFFIGQNFLEDGIFHIERGGNIGMGTSEPAHKLHVTGGNNKVVAQFEYNNEAFLSIKSLSGQAKGLLFSNPAKLDAAAIIYNDTANVNGLSFASNGVTNLLVNAGGNVGIGETNPSAKLHIKGPENNGQIAALKITANGQNMLLDGNEIDSDSDIHLNHNSNRHVYAGRGGGDMVIGGLRQNINSRLQVHGNAAKNSGGTTWSTFSDRRLKKNIRPYTDGLEQLLRIKPVRYRYNGQLGTSDKQEEIGIIAQDMQQIAPYMIDEFEHQDEKGRTKNYLTYNSNALFYMLVNGVKSLHQNNLDQQEVIENQSKTIRQLEHKVANLEKRFAQLEQAIQTTGQAKNESINTIELKATAQLSQNHPNPFHEFTHIQYSIPNGVQKAILRIADTSGKVLKEEILNATNVGQIQIKATHFPAGTYYYSLILDGQLFETKRMILAWK